MNFDLSALEKLQEKGTATKDKKFAPTSRARPVRMKRLTVVFSCNTWDAVQDPQPAIPRCAETHRTEPGATSTW